MHKTQEVLIICSVTAAKKDILPQLNVQTLWRFTAMQGRPGLSFESQWN